MALLSIGEEAGKGNELTREAYPRLKALPLNFVGNVEGRDVFSGAVEVIVCDGFIGNVALKVSEGVAQHIGMLLKKALKSTVAVAGWLRALAQRLQGVSQEHRLHRIRRRAAAGGSRHHRDRTR